MPQGKMRIRTGDRVQIVVGKDKGKVGNVLRSLPRENRVIIEGLNMVSKHQRASRQMMQGGIIEQPSPVHVSNVKLVCRNCDRPVRTGSRTLSSGRKVRYCKNCDENIDR